MDLGVKFKLEDMTMAMPNGSELLVILGVVVILFGGKKIPELAKGLGQGIRNFKNEMKEETVEVKPDTPVKSETPTQVDIPKPTEISKETITVNSEVKSTHQT